MSIVNSSGFKDRMDSLGISQSSLLVAYDFVSGSKFINGYLDNPIWVTGSQYSGKINGVSNGFYTNSGSGFFNGSNSVSISGKIPEDNFSFLFCYEKLRSGEEILLSSAAGNSFSTASGITLGLNDANKLYLEYWNPINGKTSLNYDENIGSKNLVYFRKSFGEFQLGIFDPVESKLNFSTASCDSYTYKHSDSFKIASINGSYWSSGRSFSGYFDDFYCLSGVIPQDYFSSLYSGFYSNTVSGGISGIGYFCENVSMMTGSGVILGTGITGYETKVTYSTGYVPTGYLESGYLYFVGTGITGYNNIFIGNVEDACGFLNPIYVRTPLTGNIYASGTTGIYTGMAQVVTPTYSNIELTGFLTGEVFVPVDVSVCSMKTGYYPNSIYIDSGFISSLGFDSIYSFWDCSTIHSNEAFFYTGGFYNNINLKPSYNSIVSDYSVYNYHTGSGQNLIFNNGQLLLESGWSSYIDGYSTKYNITGNIFLDGSVIRSNGYNEFSDSLIYDNSSKISGDSVYLQTGLGSGVNFSSILSSTYVDYSLFLNGVKLLSGLDYSGNKFNFEIPASSVLIKINNNYISDSKIYISGASNLITNYAGRFSNNSSQVYVNGLRQEIDDDYLEISKFDILTGCPVVTNLNYRLVYSSSSDFWNI
jgi:hypothetical protein